MLRVLSRLFFVNNLSWVCRNFGMNKILIITPTFLDIICKGFTRFPEKGEEIFIDNIELSPGGGAITALTLAQLGTPVLHSSLVGADYFGNYISNMLIER